jgi:hypothetical protein
MSVQTIELTDADWDNQMSEQVCEQTTRNGDTTGCVLRNFLLF